MDRHHGAGVRHRRRLGEEQLLVRRHEARLPVVTVQDVERLFQAAGELQRGPREEDVALGVVGKVFRAAVQAGAIVVVVVGHQQHRGGRLGPPAAQDSGHRPPRADRHLELDARWLEGEALGEHFSVGGNHEGDVAAQATERRRQGAGHVGQATGLGEGGGLAGHFEHAHRGIVSGAGGPVPCLQYHYYRSEFRHALP